MKANARRENRTSFDALATEYDHGRPEISPEIVSWACELANLTEDSRVLEIGAGTGQLTSQLVLQGFAITALEPGPNMAAILTHKFASVDTVTVVNGFFESTPFEAFEAAGFQGVMAANSFHWIDAAISYKRAASLLSANGSLILFWNFPILADSKLQRTLNEGLFAKYPDFVRNPDGYRDALEASLSDGRRELNDSRCFASPQWRIVEENLKMSLARFIDLLLSYANAAQLDASQRTVLTEELQSALGGRATVAITNYVYGLVAKLA